MALGSTQSLTEMSTGRISWGGKGGRGVRLTTLPPSCVVVMKFGYLIFLEPSGPLQACNGTDLPFLPRTLIVFIVTTVDSVGNSVVHYFSNFQSYFLISCLTTSTIITYILTYLLTYSVVQSLS